MAVVGRVARAHGLRGQVIVNLETDFPEARFQPGAELFIERGGAVTALRLTTVRFHRDRPVIGIEGTMAGSRLVIDGARGEILIPLADDICPTIDVDAKRIVVEPPDGLL